MMIICLLVTGLFVGCSRTEGSDITSDNETTNRKSEDIEVNDKDENAAEEENGSVIFSTEYTVEDYCQGCFIVSKSDGLLYGVLNKAGEEIIPVKYDDIRFVNDEEVQEGIDSNLYLSAEYENSYVTFDSSGIKLFDFRTYRVDYKLGQSEDGLAFFENIDKEKVIRLYSEKGTLLCEVSALQQDDLDSTNINSEQFTVDLIYISKNNFIVSITGITNEGSVYRHLSLYDIKGNIIRQWNDRVCGSFKVEENTFAFLVPISKDSYEINTIDENGNFNELGLLENQNVYYLDTVHGLEKKEDSQSVEESKYDYIYYLGKNNEIKLYETNNTWKLVDKNEQPLYEERYFDCYYRDTAYFLLNENNQMCLISGEGKMVVPSEYISWTGSVGKFNNMEITDENCFIGYNDAVFIVSNKGKSEVYYFRAE